MGHCYPTVRQHHFPHLLSPGKTALWLLFFSEAGSGSGVSVHACPAPLRLSCVLWHTSRQRRHLQVPLLGPAFLATPAERCFVVKLLWFGVTFCLPHALGAVL